MTTKVYPPLTADEVRDILHRRKSGWTWRQLEVAFRRPQRVILRDMRAFGVAPAYERKPAPHEPQPPVPSAGWPLETIERMITLYKEGRSMGEIGELIGKTRNAVIGKLHRQGYSAARVLPPAPPVRSVPSVRSVRSVPLAPPAPPVRSVPSAPPVRSVPSAPPVPSAPSLATCATPGCRNPRQKSVGTGQLCSICERDRIASKPRKYG